jgi:hypothetical protein
MVAYLLSKIEFFLLDGLSKNRKPDNAATINQWRTRRQADGWYFYKEAMAFTSFYRGPVMPFTGLSISLPEELMSNFPLAHSAIVCARHSPR